MSDLLQRMIERTRTPRPAIRPQPVSRYASDAPAIGAFAAPEMDASAARELESDAQIGSPAAAPHRSQAEDRSLGQTPSRRASSRRIAAGAGESSTLSTKGSVDPLGVYQVRHQTRSAVHPAADVTIHSIENPQEEFAGAAERAEEAPSELPPKIAAITGSLVDSAPEASAHKSSLDARAPYWRDAAPVAQPPLARATVPAVEVREQQSQRNHGPEINISIGHIEVRAARAAESPRKPAFRPQLSLDDFLHGKPGASR